MSGQAEPDIFSKVEALLKQPHLGVWHLLTGDGLGKRSKPMPSNGLDGRPYQHQQNQRVASRPVPSKEPAVPRKNGLLDVNEAATLLGMSPKWVYRNWRNLPHTLIPAGRKPRIRFKREALEAWIQSHSFDQRRRRQ